MENNIEDQRNKALDLYDEVAEVTSQIRKDFGFSACSEVQGGVEIPQSTGLELHADHHAFGFDPTVILAVLAVQVGSNVRDWINSVDPGDRALNTSFAELPKNLESEVAEYSGMQATREVDLERPTDMSTSMREESALFAPAQEGLSSADPNVFYSAKTVHHDAGGPILMSDSGDAWRQAQSEVFGRTNTSGDSEQGIPEPTRPEGPRVSSPGWSGQGDMVAENAAANERHQWLNDATDRDRVLHEQLEQRLDTPSAADSNDRSSDQPTLDQYVENPSTANERSEGGTQQSLDQYLENSERGNVPEPEEIESRSVGLER